MAGDKEEFNVYNYRWVVLIVYLLAAMTIQMLWTTFFSITSEASKYYGYSNALEGDRKSVV